MKLNAKSIKHSMAALWSRRKFWMPHFNSFVTSVVLNALILFLLLQLAFVRQDDSSAEIEVQVVEMEVVELEDMDIIDEIEEEVTEVTDMIQPTENFETAPNPPEMVASFADSPLRMAALNGLPSTSFKGLLDTGKSATRFMGETAKGNRFAFIIDYSKSMNKHQLAVMKHELYNAVQQVGEKGWVTLLFFSGPVWRPDQDALAIEAEWHKSKSKEHREKMLAEVHPKWMIANERNMEALKRMIYTTPRTLGTDWYQPIKLALDMTPRPDMIVFMTDGTVADRISDMTLEYVTNLPPYLVRINTVALGVSEEDAKPLKTLAESTGGSYRLYDKDEIVKKAQSLPEAPSTFANHSLDYLGDDDIKRDQQKKLSEGIVQDDDISIEIL